MQHSGKRITSEQLKEITEIVEDRFGGKVAVVDDKVVVDLAERAKVMQASSFDKVMPTLSKRVKTIKEKANMMLYQPPITMRNDPIRQRRNESCACGSGKKYKKCCLRNNRFTNDP